MKRRVFVSGTLAAFALSALDARAGDAGTQFARLETSTGGRLGVTAIDTGSGRAVTYRADERFPMCSTFKFLAAAAVLSRVDRGADRLSRKVRYGKNDLLEWAPVTSKHVAEGFMTLEALCAAAIEYSDNTAANLLVETLGGPNAVTAYARSVGDAFTRLDRTEPALNTAIPGDLRDTTTPAAMANNLRTILLGNVLSERSKGALSSWLVACTSGRDLLRAGLPPTWRAGDKTGMGGRHNAFGDSDTRNDIAIAWPLHGSPLVIAAYLTGSKLRAAQRDAVLAAVSRIVVPSLGH